MFVDAVTWLCQSPRRLAIGAVTVLTVLLVGGALFGHPGGGGGGSVASAKPAAKVSATAQVPDANPYVTAGVAFVRVWSQLKAGESAAQWHSSLLPLTTPELGESLGTTDPSRLPGVPPSGEPVVRFLTQTSALIAVPLSDGTSVLVTLVSQEQGTPLVSDIQPDAGN